MYFRFFEKIPVSGETEALESLYLGKMERDKPDLWEAFFRLFLDIEEDVEVKEPKVVFRVTFVSFLVSFFGMFFLLTSIKKNFSFSFWLPVSGTFVETSALSERSQRVTTQQLATHGPLFSLDNFRIFFE